MSKQERSVKREKFTQQKGNNGKYIAIIVVAVALIAGLIGYNLFSPAKDSNATNGIGGNYQAGKTNYGSGKVEQTVVKFTAENGKVKLAKEDIEKNKFVYTEYKKGDKMVPLTAFVNTEGRVVVAFSMCEPCKGTRFHVEGDELVCNTCGARWKLTGYQPVSGAPACLKYPPEEIKYADEGGFLTMDESKVAAWVPRV